MPSFASLSYPPQASTAVTEPGGGLLATLAGLVPAIMQVTGIGSKAFSVRPKVYEQQSCDLNGAF